MNLEDRKRVLRAEYREALAVRQRLAAALALIDREGRMRGMVDEVNLKRVRAFAVNARTGERFEAGPDSRFTVPLTVAGDRYDIVFEEAQESESDDDGPSIDDLCAGKVPGIRMVRETEFGVEPLPPVEVKDDRQTFATITPTSLDIRISLDPGPRGHAIAREIHDVLERAQSRPGPSGVHPHECAWPKGTFKETPA